MKVSKDRVPAGRVVSGRGNVRVIKLTAHDTRPTLCLTIEAKNMPWADYPSISSFYANQKIKVEVDLMEHLVQALLGQFLQ